MALSLESLLHFPSARGRRSRSLKCLLIATLILASFSRRNYSLSSSTQVREMYDKKDAELYEMLILRGGMAARRLNQDWAGYPSNTIIRHLKRLKSLLSWIKETRRHNFWSIFLFDKLITCDRRRASTT
jgi:hypothetical protein